MGLTIQFESHTVELAFIYEYEHDKVGVLEYYDQPPPIKLNYKGKGKGNKERNLGYMHTPDFFVIRPDSAGYEECKTEEKLIQLSAKSPNRYVRGEDGEWRCPPGEEFAAQHNLYYRLRSSATIDWTFQRNIIFLEDYLRVRVPSVPEKARKAVLELVEVEPGITLRNLLLQTEEMACSDDIYMMIATEQICVDWRAAALAEPDTVHIFPDQETAAAYSRITRVPAITAANLIHKVDCKIGSKLAWDNKKWQVINPGETKVGLLSEEGEYMGLPGATFDELVKRGEIVGVVETDEGQSKEVQERFSVATRKDCMIANRRYEFIFPEFGIDGVVKRDIDERTLRRYRAKYRNAEALYGCGYIGLLPERDESGNGQGNHNPKLPEATRLLTEDFIANKFETYKQQGMFEVHALLKRECEERGIVHPSYKSFTKMVKAKPIYRQTLNRKGRRAAYKFKPAYWNLSQTTPRHGDRPFECVHIDHTELDVELVCSRTGRNLGRPWATFVVDARSRRLLVVYVTYDKPSYRTCMMVLRECVRLYGRLPQFTIVDNASEFRSIYFQTLLARYGCTIKYRPKAHSKAGSVCERLFGSTNTQFVHNLAGNTQITKTVREMTKSVNPKNLALWTLYDLYEKLCEYAHEVYNAIDHPALGVTPAQAYAADMKQKGERDQTKIPYDEDFRMMTMPTTDKGTAKVLPGKGVKINNIFYDSDAFLNPDVENKQTPVRYDPFNMGVAYALVLRRWIRCISEHYSTFNGRSEKEVALACAELRQRHRQHSRGYFTITARRLADFLNSVEAQEILLMQRAKDRESRSIIEKINSFAGVRESSFPEETDPQINTDTDSPDESGQAGQNETKAERKVARTRRVIEEF
jgi:transposase InsO family protein